MLLGKFTLLQVAKYWKIIWQSGQTGHESRHQEPIQIRDFNKSVICGIIRLS